MRLSLAVVMVLFLFGCSGDNSTKEMTIDPDDPEAYHENKYFDAYVLSKSINSFSVVDELDDKSSKVIVTMANKDDRSLIRKLKRKQKVRIWHDYLRESLPGQTTAYHVEVLE